MIRLARATAASILLALAGTGCECADDDPPAVLPPTATSEPAPPPPSTTEPAAPAPEPVGDLSSPEARWEPILAFDAGSHDLSIASFALHEEPPLARASAFSMRFCHGDDPVGAVISLGLGATLDRNPDQTRAQLRCGAFVAEHTAEGARVHVLELDRTGPPAPLLAIATDLTEIAPFAAHLPRSHAERLGDTDLLCVPFDPGSCAERNDAYDEAAAILEGHLVVGSYRVLAQLLAWDARPRLFALLRSMSARLAAIADVEVDFLAPGGRWTIGPRRWLPYTVVGSSDDLAETVRTSARAVVWEHGMREGTILIAPRCADASACPEAETLEAAFRTFHTTWRETARERMQALLEDGASSACSRSEEDAYVAALEQASLARRGTRTVMSYAASSPADPACEEARARTVEGAAARVHDVLGDP